MTTTHPSSVLVRPVQGRLIAGVALGIAQRLDLPAWLVRVAFVALMAAGGAGLLLYLAGWALIPAEGESTAAATRWLENLHGGRAWAGIALLGVAAVVIAENTNIVDADLALAGVLFVIGVLLYRGDLGRKPVEETDSSQTREAAMSVTTSGQAGPTTPADIPPPPPPPPVPADVPPPPPPPAPKPKAPPSILGRLTVGAAFLTLGILALIEVGGSVDLTARHYLSTLLVVIGAGLLVGTFWGRARWLIVVGIILTPVVLASPIADYDFADFEARGVTHRPQTVAEVQPSYQEDVAQLVVDLRAVDFTGETVEMDAHVDLGELVVLVPGNTAVEASGQVDIGEVEIFGRSSGGLGDVRRSDSVDGSAGRLIVDASADVGRVEISQRTGARLQAGVGDRDLVIAVPADLETSYRVDAGDLTLDLSDLRIEQSRDVTISMGVGQVTIDLPRSGAVEVQADVSLGDITLPNATRSGIDVSADYTRGEGPVLSLDIDVDAGSIVVEEAS